MAANVEIKARCRDWEGQRARARVLADEVVELVQEDVFFPCAHGRLKLRDLGAGQESYLVAYRRDDEAGPKTSLYETSPVPDPASMRRLLGQALGEGRSLRKKRTVFMTGRTRLHFDEVEGLGRFIEIEVVLAPGEDPEAGRSIARDFMARLGIEDADLLRQAYVDMAGCPS